MLWSKLHNNITILSSSIYDSCKHNQRCREKERDGSTGRQITGFKLARLGLTEKERQRGDIERQKGETQKQTDIQTELTIIIPSKAWQPYQFPITVQTICCVFLWINYSMWRSGSTHAFGLGFDTTPKPRMVFFRSSHLPSFRQHT